MGKNYGFVYSPEKMMINSESKTPIADYHGVPTLDGDCDYEEVICLISKKDPSVLIMTKEACEYEEFVLSKPIVSKFNTEEEEQEEVDDIDDEKDTSVCLSDEEIRAYDTDRPGLLVKLTSIKFEDLKNAADKDKHGHVKEIFDFYMTCDIEKLVTRHHNNIPRKSKPLIFD